MVRDGAGFAARVLASRLGDLLPARVAGAERRERGRRRSPRTTRADSRRSCADAATRQTPRTARVHELESGMMPTRSSNARTRIPAEVVVLLRGALYTELARACEDAPGGMPEAHTRSGWADVLARIGGARNALDVLGWDTPARQQDVEVELDR